MTAFAALSYNSQQLFLEICDDAWLWEGQPPKGDYEPTEFDPLVAAGLLTTEIPGGSHEEWITFTEAGKAVAAEHGYGMTQDRG